MNNLSSIKHLPYWEDIATHALNILVSKAEIINLAKGTVLTEQFQSASHFYLLCEGAVEHYLTLLNENKQPVSVGKLDKPWCAVGWSALVEPYRYTTQVICSAPSTVLRWKHETIQNLAKLYPEISLSLLGLIAESGKILLEQSRGLMKQDANLVVNEIKKTNVTPKLRLKVDTDKGINYLSYSSLFQDLRLSELKQLAEHCWLERYQKGSTIFSERESTTDILILIKGTVTLCYSTDTADTKTVDNSKIFIRTLSQRGQIVSWAALTQSQRQDISVIASDDVLLCCVPASIIKQYCFTRTDLAIKLQKKLIQIVGSRLRSARALLIKQQSGNEHTTVNSLIHNVGPQLSIHSSLHKLPYLLKHRITQEDAFYHLDKILNSGSNIEKNVAGLCNDILKGTRREVEFYKGLNSIYHMVVTENKTEKPQSIRNKSARLFVKLFSNIPHVIKGKENLPETGGHIFIMNHLVSHPYHELANGFEFSLDTHFLSSMILYKKYADSGVRIVRKNRHEEYGHESYYERLGHIYAYTNESSPVDENTENNNWRNKLFNEATEQLNMGNNIIMCPEGTSYLSHESPGPFKSGAFRLAAMQTAETLIVPVVVANFDKKLCDAVFTAIIKQPFKIDDFVDINEPDALQSFLTSLNGKYQSYFNEAQQMSMTQA